MFGKKGRSELAWYLIITCAVAAFGIGAETLFFRNYQSIEQSEVEASQAGLMHIWPAFASMPAEDRELLVGLGIACHVGHPPSRTEADLAACFRYAVTQRHALLPHRMDQRAAQVRLEQLLRQSNF